MNWIQLMLREQNPPSVEEQDFQQESHATGLYHTQLSASSTYCSIFSQIDGENKDREQEESYTVALSEMLG